MTAELIPWQALAVGMSVVWAAYVLINQHFRLSPRILLLWRGLGMTILAGLAVPFTGLPSSPAFVMYAAICGLLVCLIDRVSFQVVLDYGAGAAARLAALGLPLAFFIWCLLHPGHLTDIMLKPHGWLIWPALLGIILSVFFMRKNAVSMQALKAMLPAIIALGLLDVFGKTAFSHAQGLPAYVGYTLVGGIVLALANIFWGGVHIDGRRLGLALTARRSLLGGACIVAATLAFMLTKLPALEHTPNPGFVQAFAQLAPLWVLLWNRWHGVKDEANPKLGLICAASVALLALATV